MFVRFARRLANWEGELSLAELQEREFKAKDGGPDLAPSIYELNETELLRAYAEHSTQFDPPRESLALDVTGATESTRSMDGNPAFDFIRTRHREVVLPDRAALLRFIAGITATTTGRYVITKQAIVGYARDRLSAAPRIGAEKCSPTRVLAPVGLIGPANRLSCPELDLRSLRKRA